MKCLVDIDLCHPPGVRPKRVEGHTWWDTPFLAATPQQVDGSEGWVITAVTSGQRLMWHAFDTPQAAHEVMRRLSSEFADIFEAIFQGRRADNRTLPMMRARIKAIIDMERDRMLHEHDGGWHDDPANDCKHDFAGGTSNSAGDVHLMCRKCGMVRVEQGTIKTQGRADG